MDWCIEEIFKLIALYKQFPCLWDFKSPEYKRLDKKKNAWIEISKSMEKDEETVKKKVKNLRSAYLIERKKVVASKRSGSAAEAVYEPHLYYYTEMKFLDNAIIQRNTSSNIPEEADIIEYSPNISLSYDSEENVATNLGSGTPLSEKKKKAAKRIKLENEEKFNNVLDTLATQINNEIKENDSMFLTFGKLIGMQLAKLPLPLATDTMAEMQAILAQKVQMSVSKKDILQQAIDQSSIL